MQNIFLFSAFLVLMACTSTKQTAEPKSPNQASQNTVLPDSIYRFSVSFISIGSGPDRKAKQQFDQFINQFSDENNVKINSEMVQWGREGETDYCLKLDELNKDQQNKFIVRTKELLKSSTLVRYSENGPCRRKRNVNK